ncbi:MAG: isopentenyl-diphosphate Delta-isomerase [Chitinophagaceae bacterium]|nr:MAG: isopentenyl-diphosphate Delta-isomerase [Chitinophagaceae bacterium]
MSKDEYVVLVNKNDREVGIMEKMEAHEKGLLHRAFSVLVFNKKGEWLLQKRADDKYHSPAKWTNTCCSHPRPEEKVEDAAARRLQEEMGFNTPLKHKFSFIYKAEFENNLIEHEFDHVFIGYYDKNPELNTQEASSYCWKKTKDISTEIQSNPENFTPWFKIIFERFLTENSVLKS